MLQTLAHLPRLALLALIGLVAWGVVPATTLQPSAWAQASAPQITDAPRDSRSERLQAPPTSPPASASATDSQTSKAKAAGVPDKVFDVLAKIQARDGQPLLGYVGGRTFENRERRLPRGRYREYDVNPKVPGRNRGAERLVIEQRTGKAFYTDDHYRTFTPLN